MALLYPGYPKAVVAIGTKEGNRFVADSTGFVVHIPRRESDEGMVLPKQFEGGVPEVLIVTNRHVFDGRDNVTLRIGSKLVPLPLKDLEGLGWTNHQNKNVDIAVSFIPNVSSIDAMVFHERTFATTDVMIKEGISVGDEVYALGFPLRLAGEERNYPIVRGGIIARLDDEILKNHYYYVDVAIYPGNSGGPVILKPAAYSIGGTSKVTNAYLIGVVASVEMQPQTLYGIRNNKYETRMVLYEHANLGRVVPMECVKEAVDYLKRRIDQRKPKAGKKKS